jgi:hypothetical protein
LKRKRSAAAFQCFGYGALLIGETMKEWRVSDSGNSIEEDFATEDEAMAFAETSLDLYREEAKDDGEWSPEVDFLTIYKLAYSAQIGRREVDEEDGIERVDYDILPIAP